jgi:hypothetical protein
MWQQRRPLAAPVIKISPEGEVKATFSADPAGRFTEADLTDFAIGPGGEVYILAIGVKEQQEPEVDVVAFAEDGSHRWSIKLEHVFVAERLAVFPTGHFLVAGRKWIKEGAPGAETSSEAAKGGSPLAGEPYTAIYDRSGRVVRELTLPGDVSPGDASLSDAGRRAARTAISLSTTVAGDDGNVYLMRRTEKALVFALSADGTVVRRFEVEPPSADMRPVTMQRADGGRLLIEFAKKVGERQLSHENEVFSIVDSESGERVLDYKIDGSESPGSFACYSAGGLTLLGRTREGQLALRRAVARY